MQASIKYFFYNIRTSFWFIPTIMLIGAIFGAMLLDEADRWLKTDWVESFPWLFDAKADGARALLSTIAGSVITVVSLVFSITLLVLSNASSQLGPRLLSSFMGDRFVQVVLGTFISCAVFSLLVLRTIEGGDGGYVPRLSIGIALIYAVFALMVLVVFFHHLSKAIQADTIIASIRNSLDSRIEDFFETHGGSGTWGAGDESEKPEESSSDFAEVCPDKSGYLQTLDYTAMVEICEKHELTLEVLLRPGDFVAKNEPMLRAGPKSRLDDDAREALLGTVVIGGKRTDAQDIGFAFSQLVEIAVRALSPGVNDPNTAIACIDHLSAALANVVRQPPPQSEYATEDGDVVVFASTITFSDLLESSFSEIRQNAAGQITVLVRLIEGLMRIAVFVSKDRTRNAIRRHAEMIERAARASVEEDEDLEWIESHIDRLEAALAADV